MAESIADLLDEAGRLPLNNSSRNRLEERVLEATEITNMEQLATLVEAVAARAAAENASHGDREMADSLFAGAQTISESLRRMHDIIQSMA
jgi:predicted house-cleaning noncanonical NTP pyrophosphatase (MazG superfamily)